MNWTECRGFQGLAQYLFCATLAFVAVIALLVRTDNFPGQGRSNRALDILGELKWSKPEKGKVPSFWISVPLNEGVYRHGIPFPLTPNIWLHGELYKNWTVDNSAIYDVSKAPDRYVESVPPYNPPNALAFHCVNLPRLSSDGNYRLDVLLSRTSETDEAAERLNEEIRDEIFSKHNLQVLDRPIP